MKLNEKFDLEITVKHRDQNMFEKILIDNGYAYNAVTLVFHGLIEFTIYGIGFTSVQAIKMLIKQANIVTL
jgi:hypothetical protein